MRREIFAASPILGTVALEPDKLQVRSDIVLEKRASAERELVLAQILFVMAVTERSEFSHIFLSVSILV